MPGVYLVLVLLAAAGNCYTVPLDADNIDEMINKQPSFVLLYAEWCSFCVQLKPMWDLLEETFRNTNDVLIGRFDADKNHLDKYRVDGFPTVKFFHPDGSKPKNYEGPRTVDALVEFVNTETGLTFKAKKPSMDGVEILSGSNFENFVSNKSVSVLAVFHSVNCIHCKNFLPELPSIGQSFIGDPSVAIAIIDGSQYSELSSKYSVSGFPTIMWFPENDKSGIQYEESRSPPAIIDYINTAIGTHRKLGGSFTNDAYPSDEIKALTEQFRSAESKYAKKDILQKTKSAAEKANGRFAKYARFYFSIMKNCIEKGSLYINKESNRLTKLINGNQITEDKRAEFFFRINILEQIEGFETEEKDEL